ncbi:hypothetical protein NMG60_11007702 [Bertholletia excelsa]
MSTMESYGVVGEGGGGGIMQYNSNNSAPQTSQASGGSVGLMPNMRLAFCTDGTAVYKPVMPPNSPITPSLMTTPPQPSQLASPAYQSAGDGSAVEAATPSIEASAGTETRRKRGRPRKYGADGSLSAGLTSSTKQPRQRPEAALHSGGLASPTVASPAATAALPSGKKPRGRPPGSGKKNKVAALGSKGLGFAIHVIIVNVGEDVCSKIMSFSQNGSRTICILSANGAISSVTLRQVATSGGTVTYEGRFEIISLEGSYMLMDSGGQRSRTGGLSVLLSGPDGRVLGGGVAGLLVAATPVQVVVGCFRAGKEGLKSPKQADPILKSPKQADPITAPPKFVPGASAAEIPASSGTLGESTGRPGSPLNQTGGACKNVNSQAVATLSWK